MVRNLVGAVCMSAIWATGAHAQGAVQNTTSAPSTKVSTAPSMSSKATTLAPVAPGSSELHRVPTPKTPDRTTATGGNTNGGAN